MKKKFTGHLMALANCGNAIVMASVDGYHDGAGGGLNWEASAAAATSSVNNSALTAA